MSFAAPLFHVEAVQGTTARLPCNLTSPIEGDRVSLVIWYKEGQSTPIYSFDVRHTEVLAKGLHHEGTGGLTGRSHFNTTSLPSFIISNVKGHDNGLYRCRADFIKSPTRNIKIQLSVIGKILYHYRNAYKHYPISSQWPWWQQYNTIFIFITFYTITSTQYHLRVLRYLMIKVCKYLTISLDRTMKALPLIYRVSLLGVSIHHHVINVLYEFIRQGVECH